MTLHLFPVMMRELGFTHNYKTNSKGVGIHGWLCAALGGKAQSQTFKKVI